MIVLAAAALAGASSSSEDDLTAMSEDEIDLAAYSALRDDDLDAAAAAFGEMVRRDEGDAFAHMWLGQVAVRAGDLERAERAFERAHATVDARVAASTQHL